MSLGNGVVHLLQWNRKLSATHFHWDVSRELPYFSVSAVVNVAFANGKIMRKAGCKFRVTLKLGIWLLLHMILS